MRTQANRMRSVLPLPHFNPAIALPEHYLEVEYRLNFDLLPRGFCIHLPVGTFSSMEQAMEDPRTQITYNGYPVSPWELKLLNVGSNQSISYIGAK